MIRIESIAIENFRGIKRLKLPFEKESFGICGPNGTGKSGVVDAIEFGLTGNVTRLTGKGTSGLSVKAHGPHVDLKDQPQNASVVLSLFFPTLNKSATIERRVHQPKEIKITPAADLEIETLVNTLAEHPEFALSRREILKYILTEPGERSKEVQALLKLDDVEKVRKALQTIANTCKSEATRFEADVAGARSQLLIALKIEELKHEAIIEAANERRKTLGIAPLATLEKDTSLKSDLTPVAASTQKPKVNKSLALTELDKLLTLTSAKDSEELNVSIGKIDSALEALEKEPRLLLNLKKQTFLQSGLDLVDGEYCPLCDKEWNVTDLKHLLQKKVDEAKEAKLLKTLLDVESAKVGRSTRELSDLVAAAEVNGRGAEASCDFNVLTTWVRSLRSLGPSLATLENISETRTTLRNGWKQVPKDAVSVLDVVKARLGSLPDASKEDEAKEYLTLCQERLEVYRKARRQAEMWKNRSAIAAKAAAAYGDASKTVLTQIYQEVEKDFSRYYQAINREDEPDFHGKLTPSLGKLGFEVDFYGRGFYPPGAYHSEGHQDGMGLCLYLALMRRILGDHFTFAVLDDVLMSVDAGHRKEVCKLLKAEFPNTQFIFTTHDSVWLHHMISERMVTNKSVVQFRKWTVDDGPMVWNHQDVWEEIKIDLDKNDISGASASLRRYLEYISNDLSSRLRATVEFRSGGGYDLGDLLPAVISAWGSLLGKAKASAQDWSQSDQVEKLKAVHEDFKKKVVQSQIEQWAINKAVHYNEWANLQKEDFEPVVHAFQELIDCFKCKTCGGLVFASPARGNADLIRCDCNAINMNLKKRP